MSDDTIKLIACTTVARRLELYNSVLIGIRAANIRKLQRVQNSLARIVVGSKLCYHIIPVLAELCWLLIQYRIQYRLAFLTFKALTTQQPNYRHELICVCNSARQLQCSRLMLLHNDRTKLSFADRAFSLAAPTLRNSLSQCIICDLSISTATCESHLKTVLYSRAFC
jgi:hypothetical protein